MANISISSLYNSVTAYADQLKQKGFTVVTFKFKAGNQAGIGPSYVELEVAKGDFYIFVKILANGYGSTHDNHISTADGWKAAKAQIQARIDKEAKFIAHTTTDNTVTINGQVYIASEVATTQDDNAACVESRWNLFNIDGTRDERTDTGQCGFLARWFDGRFGFWLVGTPHRIVLQKTDVRFGKRPYKRQTRKTDYQKGELLEIVETTFHDYPLGMTVKVMHADWHSYHVYNVNPDGTSLPHEETRYWWVNENQVKPAPKSLQPFPVQPDADAIAAHEANYPTTSDAYGLFETKQREGLLSGVWLNDEPAVKVVTDHPEAEAIDAAFDASNLQKFFFTCGQAHSHDVDGVTWNKDSVLQVMAVDENAARELVFSRFGPKWSHQYDEATMDFEYFPNGICATICA